MTDGLDCKEVMMSVVKENSDFFRLDSHCFEKRFEFLKQTLKYVHCKRLSELVSKPIQTGHTPSMSNAENYGGNIAFIKTDNLHSNDISDIYNDYLSDKGNSEIFRTFLQPKDIITTIIGATEDVIARSAIICPAHLPANINQNIVQIRINSNIICPEYVNIYLNSKYGRNYLILLSRQTEQVNLNCQEVGGVLIPIFSDNLCKTIQNLSTKAYKLQLQTKKIYASAEKLLDVYLMIENFDEYKHTIKSLTNSFIKSGRLDAEYYQPKYDSLIAQINAKETVSSLCNLYDSNFVPDSDREYNYIELSNVGISGNISNVEKVIGNNLPSRARRLVQKGQVIVSSIEGSLSSCALIDSEYDCALCSTGFYVIDSDKINSETLLVLFKSKPIQALLKQRCSGTILTAISKDEFLNMPLPTIDEVVQKEISYKIQESFRLRKEAKRLLDKAIKAVEIAIETDEETALNGLMD